MRHRYSCHQSSDLASSKNLTIHPVKPVKTFFWAMWTKNILEALPTGNISFLSLQGHPRVGSHIVVVYLCLLSATDFSSISPSHRELPMKHCEPMKGAEGGMAALGDVALLEKCTLFFLSFFLEDLPKAGL